MKNHYFLLLVALFSFTLARGQSYFYSVPVTAIDQYLRDSSFVLGRLDLDFPVDGKVFVQFDGEGYGSPGDRIILGANNYPEWDTNDGNVNFFSSIQGERHCFSHTRTFSVAAGHHSFYAVAQNYVETTGSGIATIYGTLSVEFIPASSDITGQSSITVGQFEPILPTAYDTITIEAAGAGKIEVRLNGAVDLSYGDIFVVGISESVGWNYTHPDALVLEADHEISPYIVFSDTKVFNVPGPGSYTFYAMVQRAYKEEGIGFYYAYTNLHARFYPQESENMVSHKKVQQDNLNLNANLTLLDSIQLEVIKPGQVEVRFDGSLKSPIGKNILIAANNEPSFTLEGGSVILQTNDEGLERHNFVHTRVFNVEPGKHTYYIMTELYEGAGSAMVDLKGNFIVKYYEENLVSSSDQITTLDFEVWPNPAQDEINIQYQNENESLEVSVIDLEGRILLHQKNILQASTMDVSHIAAGMYLVLVSNGIEQGFRKMVKL